MSLMDNINISHQELVLPVTKQGQASASVNRQATAVDFRSVTINTNNTTGEKSADIKFVYGTIVNGIFQELDLLHGDKETIISIDKATFEALAGSPLTPNEMSSNPHEIIYSRIVGYMKAQGIIK